MAIPSSCRQATINYLAAQRPKKTVQTLLVSGRFVGARKHKFLHMTGKIDFDEPRRI